MSQSEEMRDDLRRVIQNYPNPTVGETLGVLQLLSFEWCQRLANSVHPDAQKTGDSAKPDLNA